MLDYIQLHQYYHKNMMSPTIDQGPNYTWNIKTTMKTYP